MNHKSGFVNILGNPNVGKSTLMNALVGERLSIITSKAQTTRHRILGIVNGDDFQIVYSDTPGIINQIGYKLHESMMTCVKGAFNDADLILYVTDLYEKEINEELTKKLSLTNIPVFIIINKMDRDKDGKADELESKWKQITPNAKIFKISALNKEGTSDLIENIKNELPECPPYFDKEDLTDRPFRFFVSEIIREKIFLNYKKEIPYSTEVVIEDYQESDEIVRIRAIIFVVRDSQKGIIIGHKGASIKKMGTEARLDIEEFIGNKVFLDLHVKVDKDWRNNENRLKQYGY